MVETAVCTSTIPMMFCDIQVVVCAEKKPV